MSKPRPEESGTLGQHLWKRHLWRRRTGGNLLGTAAIALIIGGLSGGAAVFLTLLVVGLALHLWLRHTRA